MTHEHRPVDEASALRRTQQARLDEVVRDVCTLHETLADIFETLVSQATHEQTQLLYRFLVQHERDTARELQQFLEDCPENLRMRWFKYSPATPLQELHDGLAFTPDIDPDTASQEMLRVNRAIETVLTPMEDAAVTDELTEALANLRRREQEHAVRATKAATNR